MNTTYVNLRYTNRFEYLENTLAEVLSEHHISAEVEFVFRHFQSEPFRSENGIASQGRANPAGHKRFPGIKKGEPQ